jgi:hypothetical protein
VADTGKGCPMGKSGVWRESYGFQFHNFPHKLCQGRDEKSLGVVLNNGEIHGDCGRGGGSRSCAENRLKCLVYFLNKHAKEGLAIFEAAKVPGVLNEVLERSPEPFKASV